MKIQIRSGVHEARWFVRILVAVALLMLSIAVHELIVPSSPPFKGRLAWLGELAFNLAGSAGIAVLWLLTAGAILLVARFVWRHAPKSPSDGWLM